MFFYNFLQPCKTKLFFNTVGPLPGQLKEVYMVVQVWRYYFFSFLISLKVFFQLINHSKNDLKCIICFLTLSQYRNIFDICRRLQISAFYKYHVEIDVIDRTRSTCFSTCSRFVIVYHGKSCMTNPITQVNFSRDEKFCFSGYIF